MKKTNNFLESVYEKQSETLAPNIDQKSWRYMALTLKWGTTRISPQKLSLKLNKKHAQNDKTCFLPTAITPELRFGVVSHYEPYVTLSVMHVCALNNVT